MKCTVGLTGFLLSKEETLDSKRARTLCLRYRCNEANSLGEGAMRNSISRSAKSVARRTRITERCPNKVKRRPPAAERHASASASGERTRKDSSSKSLCSASAVRAPRFGCLLARLSDKGHPGRSQAVERRQSQMQYSEQSQARLAGKRRRGGPTPVPHARVNLRQKDCAWTDESTND